MPEPFWIDLETFSPVPLAHGTWEYARQAEIMLFPYARGDRAPKCWDLTEDPTPPAEVEDALLDERTTLIAHNGAGFDRVILNHKLHATPIARWWDTMIQAYLHGLPGGLGVLCDIFGIPLESAKAKDGKRLIHLFCKPLPKNQTLRRATRHTHPKEWQEFKHYATQDINAMRAVAKAMPRWNMEAAGGREVRLWRLDVKVNDRGVLIDTELCEAAIRQTERTRRALAAETSRLTEGTVSSATQRDALLGHILMEYGVDLPDLTADTLQRRLEDQELPSQVRDLIRVRLSSSLASIHKFRAALRSVSPDGRLRGATQFGGAQRTLRKAGRLVQPQNMPRTDPAFVDLIEDFVDALKEDTLDLTGYPVNEALRAVTRGVFVAAPGRKLVITDLSNIEGRGLAWLAGEEWKLQAFRDYDTILGQDDKGEPIRKGHDLYKLAYARSFNVPPESVTKPKRQIGKVKELSMGYEGGVGAFVSMAEVYGMDLELLAREALPSLPREVRLEADRFFYWAVEQKRTLGLPQDVFVTCDGLKRLWRRAHPATVQFWADLATGFRNAILCAEGQVFHAGKHIRFDRKRDWVRMWLPSGRCICYAGAHIDKKNSITYWGVNSYTKKWSRIHTHGGKLAGNATQATARDVLFCNAPLVEDAGYPIVLDVHDELITEPPDDPAYTWEEQAALMVRELEWAKGLPLSAAGFEAPRYRKEA